MFGCPAAYIGRRMAFCVYGDAIGAKLPQTQAADWIARGAAIAFRPDGRPALKEWIQLRVAANPLTDIESALEQALDYARQLDRAA